MPTQSKNQVVHLVPPKLEQNAAKQEVACVRPMREGTFNISAEEIGDKFVVHCYGHGGSGWTTFMGSVNRAIELFILRYPDPSKAPPIRVLGAGCMGICSAIELARRGYLVQGVFAKELHSIPSWNAPGYYALVSLKVAPEEAEVINRINLSTFGFFQTIQRGEHPYLSSKAVRFLPVYCSKDTHAGVEELEAAGKIPPMETVDLDFGNGVVHRDFHKFMTFFFDVTTLMQELLGEMNRLGIPLEVRAVESFQDIEEKVIFNCTGLGGKELCKDSRMIPVRGHLVLLNESAGNEHMDYMIYTKVIQDGKEEYVYLFPRTHYVGSATGKIHPCRGVLGGSYIQGTEKLSPQELMDLDAREFKSLIDRSHQFFHGASRNFER